MRSRAAPRRNQPTLGQEKSCQIYTELLYLGHAGAMMFQSPTGLAQGLGSPWGGTQTPVCSGLQLPLCCLLQPRWGRVFVMKPNSADG